MSGGALERFPPGDWPAGTSPAARADLASRSCSHGGVLATGRAQVPLSRQPRDSAGARGWRGEAVKERLAGSHCAGGRGFGTGETALGPGRGLIVLCRPGRSYIRYSQICAQAVRAAMKPQYKAEAERAAVATVKTVKPKKE